MKATGLSRSNRRRAGDGRDASGLSPPGNFYGSTLVELRAGDPQPQTLSLAAGLALIEAIDLAVPGQALMLKWPNDVLLLGRKLAGILLERSGDRVVIGFGVNLASAPDLPDRECASLGGRVTPQAFAPLLAGSFERLLQLWRKSEPSSLAQAWLTRAHPVGTRLAVHSAPSRRSAVASTASKPTARFGFELDDGRFGDRSGRRHFARLSRVIAARAAC